MLLIFFLFSRLLFLYCDLSQCIKAWSVSSKWFSDHSGHFSQYSQHPSHQFLSTEIASLCWPLYWAIPPWQTELGSVHSACVSRLESVWQPGMCFRAAKWRSTVSSYVFLSFVEIIYLPVLITYFKCVCVCLCLHSVLFLCALVQWTFTNTRETDPAAPNSHICTFTSLRAPGHREVTVRTSCQGQSHHWRWADTRNFISSSMDMALKDSFLNVGK